jgi:hypothetical protein
MTVPAPDLRDRLAESFALQLNGPANDGRGWYRSGDERTECYARADAVLSIVQAELAERDQLRADLARVDEEIAEFQAAAEDDPTTPAACLHMIELLRLARAPKEPTS